MTCTVFIVFAAKVNEKNYDGNTKIASFEYLNAIASIVGYQCQLATAAIGTWPVFIFGPLLGFTLEPSKSDTVEISIPGYDPLVAHRAMCDYSNFQCCL